MHYMLIVKRHEASVWVLEPEAHAISISSGLILRPHWTLSTIKLGLSCAIFALCIMGSVWQGFGIVQASNVLHISSIRSEGGRWSEGARDSPYASRLHAPLIPLCLQYAVLILLIVLTTVHCTGNNVIYI